jgi:hypothetical protein
MLILSSTRQHCSDLQSVVGLNVVRRHINAVQRLINVSSTSHQRLINVDVVNFRSIAMPS